VGGHGPSVGHSRPQSRTWDQYRANPDERFRESARPNLGGTRGCWLLRFANEHPSVVAAADNRFARPCVTRPAIALATERSRRSGLGTFELRDPFRLTSRSWGCGTLGKDHEEQRGRGGRDLAGGELVLPCFLAEFGRGACAPVTLAIYRFSV
jgi:hypothetical protein